MSSFNMTTIIWAALLGLGAASPVAEQFDEIPISEYGLSKLAERSTGPPIRASLCCSRANHVCNGRWDPMPTSNATDYIGDIHARGASLRCTGPKSCTTLHSGGVGDVYKFVFCNDHTYGKCVENVDLATRGQDIIHLCAANGQVAGQTFFKDRTNVILHKSD